MATELATRETSAMKNWKGKFAMPEITRRDFLNSAAIATTAAGLSKAARASDDLGKNDGADITEVSQKELAMMFNNHKFPPRPDEPCPLPKSSAIKDVHYTYRYRSYESIIRADTWLTSWAADGNLYSSYADGSAERVGVVCHIDGVDDWYYPPRLT
jgi:hypothetical protein